MLKYITKRILITIPVLIGVVFLIFVMLSVIPGDPLTVMMGEKVKVDVIERLHSPARSPTLPRPNCRQKTQKKKPRLQKPSHIRPAYRRPWLPPAAKIYIFS